MSAGDGFGLNKFERLKRKRKEQQDAEFIVEPLDPPFPYRPTPFDPQYFGAESSSPRLTNEDDRT